MAKETSSPVYQAYTVIKREGQDDYWMNLGAAWRHADGEGLNILLHALPINGKIVLRPPKRDETERDKATIRKENDRRRGR